MKKRTAKRPTKGRRPATKAPDTVDWSEGCIYDNWTDRESRAMTFGTVEGSQILVKVSRATGDGIKDDTGYVTVQYTERDPASDSKKQPRTLLEGFEFPAADIVRLAAVFKTAAALAVRDGVIPA